MPYITQERRKALMDGITIREFPQNEGELNYLLTKIAVGYAGARKRSYATASSVVSAFECAKLEFYRRVVAPYEDEKCAENGDVYQVLNGG